MSTEEVRVSADEVGLFVGASAVRLRDDCQGLFGALDGLVVGVKDTFLVLSPGPLAGVGDSLLGVFLGDCLVSACWWRARRLIQHDLFMKGRFCASQMTGR